MKALVILLSLMVATSAEAGSHKELKFKRTRAPASSSVSCLTGEMKALLGQIQATFGPLHIVSTCRPGATIRGTRKPSYHRYGRAVDFTVPRAIKAAVVKWLIRLRAGGVMTYRNFGHIHVDTGPFFVRLGARG